MTMNKPQAQSKLPTGWPQILKIKRLQLHETQATFGKRFDVSDVAIGYWESGQRGMPANVTWWLTQNPVNPNHLGKCDGSCVNHNKLGLDGYELK